MTSKHFTTDDGVKLHYIEAGSVSYPDTIVFIPGWSMTTRQYSSQINFFAAREYHVLSFDPRGHGESDKPTFGYRVSRMARDLWNLLDHVDCNKNKKFHLVGQSASCIVILNFVELFGQDRIKSIVLIDQPTCYLKQPGWSQEECLKYGAMATTEEVASLLAKLSGPDANAERGTFLRAVFSDEFPEEQFEEVMADSLMFPHSAAVQMAWSVISGDFRDILPNIAVPTLCVGAEQSIYPAECMSWSASQMPNARTVIFPGSSHLMFLEEPESFNKVMDDFLCSLTNG